MHCLCVQIQLAKGEPQMFVTLFIIGNVIQLMGSMFIKGPVSFGKKLVSKEMRLATFLYFSAMISLIVVCYVKTLGNTDRLGLAILFIFICYVMMIFFFICSLPFGKRMLDGCLASYCKDCKKACCCAKEQSFSDKVGLTGSSNANASTGSFSSILVSKESKQKGAFFGSPVEDMHF